MIQTHHFFPFIIFQHQHRRKERAILKRFKNIKTKPMYQLCTKYCSPNPIFFTENRFRKFQDNIWLKWSWKCKFSHFYQLLLHVVLKWKWMKKKVLILLPRAASTLSDAKKVIKKYVFHLTGEVIPFISFEDHMDARYSENFFLFFFIFYLCFNFNFLLWKLKLKSKKQ